ncbi:MAG: winged helix DNA-binding domain-containing protein [Actinomycetota bacterium]
MPERVLSTRALNRALLARQGLLERFNGPLTRALERVGGLQSQYAPSAYVGLWSRLAGVRREDLTTALERRRAVQGTLMRVTIHIVSARDYPLFAAGLRTYRPRSWMRSFGEELAGVDTAALAARVRQVLGDGPRKAPEVQELLQAEGYPRRAWQLAGWLVDVVRVPPSGTWERRRADLYALADDWLGPSDVSEPEGLVHLVRRYLQGFGPASLNDLAGWAGVPATALRPVAERLSLRRFRDEHGGELLDVPRAPLPDPATRAPVRFLPTWDATLLAHARRTQVLPEEHRPLVFGTKTPHSAPTFLVDGRVAGIWRYERGRVRLDPFDPLPRAARRELEEESARLAAFHEA